MRNSEAFLNAFAEVERWVRDASGGDRSAPFARLVDRLEPTNRVVRRYYADLRQFAELRNVLVHERRGGKVLAEPTDVTVTELLTIAAALANPPRVIPRFQRDVKARRLDDTIGEAVADMREGLFSQLPITAGGKVVGLLTSETVVRWLAFEVESQLVSLTETLISKVLPHAEDADHYCVLGPKTTLHDALTHFEEYAARGKDLDAIIITDSGKDEGALRGILTIYDLPDVLENLGLRRISAA